MFVSPSFTPTAGPFDLDVVQHVARAVAPADAATAAACEALASVTRDGAAYVAPVSVPSSECARPPFVPGSDPDMALCEADLAHAIACGALLCAPFAAPLVVLCALFWVWKSDRVRVRLIHNMVRGNAFFAAPPSFTLPSVRESFAPRNGLLPTHACIVDLSEAYWHVPLHPLIRPFFGAVTSCGRHLCWSVLPFGWTWSPYVFYCVMRCLMCALAASGVWTSAYMDDIVVCGASFDECAQHTACVLRLLSAVGLRVNVAKSVLEPTDNVRYLGLDVCLKPMVCCVRWPADKARRVCVFAVTAHASGFATPRELASLCGRVNFFRSVCPIAAALLRRVDVLISESPGSWDSPVALPAGIRDDLWLLASLCARLSSSWWLLHAVHVATECSVRVDASESGVGLTIQCGGRDVEVPPSLLPPSLVGSSSTARESYGAICGVLTALAEHLPPAPAVCRVTVVCDNQAVTPMFVRGRHVPAISAHLACLLKSLTEVSDRVLLTALWSPRALMRREDLLSRVAAGDLQHAQLAVGPELFQRTMRLRDLFACAANTLGPLYVAPCCEPDASAVDAFTVPWLAGDYAFPPFALAAPVLRRLAATVRQLGQCLDALVIVPQATVFPSATDVHWERHSLSPVIRVPPDFKLLRRTAPLWLVRAHCSVRCSSPDSCGLPMVPPLPRADVPAPDCPRSP